MKAKEATMYFNRRSHSVIGCPSCGSLAPLQIPFGVVCDGGVALDTKTFRNMLRGRVLIPKPREQGARCCACGRIFIVSGNVEPQPVVRQ